MFLTRAHSKVSDVYRDTLWRPWYYGHLKCCLQSCLIDVKQWYTVVSLYYNSCAMLFCIATLSLQSLQQVDLVTGGRQRTSTISGPAYASVGPSFMHHVAAKNFGSTGNLVTRHALGRRSSLGPVCGHALLTCYILDNAHKRQL